MKINRKDTKIKKILFIFLVFFKLGVFTFGGGYAMISLLESECVEKRKWLTSEEFFKILTISETTPGPIAINMATYIGFTKAGVIGSFFATLGVVLPSFIIIYIISLFFDNLLKITIIKNAFNGIKAGVAVLIFFAGIKMLSKVKNNVFSVILMMFALACNLTISLLSINFSTIYLILIGGVLGFMAYLIANRKNLKKQTEIVNNDNAIDNLNDTKNKINNSNSIENIENNDVRGDKNDLS